VLLNLSPLDLITYRGALALRFVDNVTGAAVTDDLRVRAWAYDPAAPRAARRMDVAERSPGSGAYGFRGLPGLEGYQIGDAVPAASLAYIVHVEDGRGRYLPQTRRYDLPLMQPAVQQVNLYPAADRATPTGYATVRGQLVRTGAPAGVPPEVTAIEPARWARVALAVPPGIPGDPPVTFWGQADGQGTVVVMAPYPLLPPGVLLDEAGWAVTGAVAHQPTEQNADHDLLELVLPDLLPNTDARHDFPPFQATLEAQGTAILFGAVTVVDAGARTYAIAGPANATELNFDLSFGRPLILRTQVDGDPSHPLSELLMESA
jgi:hypothetical protein